MRITRISRTKRGLYALFADGSFLFSVHEDVFALSGLREGSNISEEELDSLHQSSNLRMAKDKALRLTARRSYTKQQLYDKLRNSADEDAAVRAADRMEELGLVDDADYALRCSRDLYHLKYCAPAGISRILRAKGISAGHVEAALEQFDCEQNAKRACEYIFRRYDGHIGEFRFSVPHLPLE